MDLHTVVPRPLVEGAEIALNYGQRYGLLGESGSGKVLNLPSILLQSIAERDVEIPEHIDIYLVRGEAEPSEVNAVDFIVASAKAKAARLEAYIEELSMADDVDEQALDMAYEELKEMDPSTFEAKASGILHGGDEEPHKGHPRLLLDKPTNHSDLGAVVWLEAYLSTYNHILVITSHSQDFTDTVCTNIMDLTHKKKLIYYSGYYSTYVKTKQENEVNQMKACHRQQDEIAHNKRFSASAGTYAHLVRQAKLKQKIIDKIEAAGLVPFTLRFNFEDVRKLPLPAIAFDNVAFSYSGKKKDYLYEKTFLRYRKFPEKDVMAWRAQLGRFGLSGAYQTAPIKQLSDGLGNRVIFAQLAMEHPHILLLDEPTNHLDMEFIDAQATAIKEFEVGIVIVSHDFRRLGFEYPKQAESSQASHYWIRCGVVVRLIVPRVISPSPLVGFETLLAAPFILKLLPSLIKVETTNGYPKVCSVVGKAIATLRQVGQVYAESGDPNLRALHQAYGKQLTHSLIGIYQKLNATIFAGNPTSPTSETSTLSMLSTI
ncbi:hypothetical protein D9613_011973 [Agrocybe pediades]|uniref:ABC transporter domain-containing protein n=1 Tax=Agrocybe pediades TaxID=84607 RepID=A0A8H4QEZ6_9AGAR|nr:hypothetical protein D9613_011973 [Agrocybe pediades]